MLLPHFAPSELTEGKGLAEFSDDVPHLKPTKTFILGTEMLQSNV